jgi:uncharacterized protein YceK
MAWNQAQYNLMPETSVEKTLVPNSINGCSTVMNNTDSWQGNTEMKPLTEIPWKQKGISKTIS